MKIRMTIAAIMCVAAILTGYAYDAPSSEEIVGNVTGIATFKTGNVNLRKGPSPNDPYLVRMVGEELYFDPEAVQWSHQTGKYMKYEKQQAFEGEMMPVIGRENGWVKLYYSNGSNPFEVWTMEKFVDISPLGEMKPGVTLPNEEDMFSQFCLKGATDGSMALYYQEEGMDEDACLYLGEKKGNHVVLSVGVPVNLGYEYTNPKWTANPINKAKPEEGIIIKYGAEWCRPKGTEYMGNFNFGNLPEKFLKYYYEGGNKVDKKLVVVATSSGNAFIF